MQIFWSPRYWGRWVATVGNNALNGGLLSFPSFGLGDHCESSPFHGCSFWHNVCLQRHRPINSSVGKTKVSIRLPISVTSSVYFVFTNWLRSTSLDGRGWHNKIMHIYQTLMADSKFSLQQWPCRARRSFPRRKYDMAARHKSVENGLHYHFQFAPKVKLISAQLDRPTMVEI